MNLSPPYIGAIDQGTTGTRFVVFDTNGVPMGDGFVAHEQSLYPPNRVEYDAMEIWECTRAAIQEGLDRARIDYDQLATIGIANQRQTTVVWDDEGEPVAPAQSWQDRRASELLGEIDSEAADRIRTRTGLTIDPYFAGPKLAWLLDRETYRGRPLRDVAEAGDVYFGTIDSWLLTKLTGRHLTDITNASQTLLYNVTDREWDDALLDRFDIPRAMLPTVLPSADPTGYGTTDVGGLLEGEIPVTGVIGNQHAALVGQAGFDVGDTKVSYGSGNFALQHVGTQPVESGSSLLTTIWFQQAGDSPCYGLEGPIFTTGTALEWLEQIGVLPEQGSLIGTDAPLDPDNQTIVIPTIGGGGSLDWRFSGGMITDVTRFSTGTDIVRGAIDGIGFATRTILDMIERASEMEIESISVDGGAITDDAFAARQAALIGRRLVRGAVSQTSALGASFTAGLGADIWSDRTELQEDWQAGRSFEPHGTEVVSERYDRWLTVARETGDLSERSARR